MHLFTYIGIVIGLLTSLILLFFPKSGKNGNWLLGLSILSLAHALIVTHLYRTGLMVDYPHWSRTGNISAYLIAPFFYLFMKHIIYRKSIFKKRDLLLLIPSVVNFFDYLPYFLLSGAEKSLIIKDQQLYNDHFLFLEGSLFPDGFQFYARQVWLLIFIVLCIKILWVNKNLLKREESKANQHIFIYLAFITITFSLAIIPGFFRFIPNIQIYTITIQAVTVSITLIGTGLFLFFNPKFLYGFFWEDEIIPSIPPSIESIQPIDLKKSIDSETEFICSHISEAVKEQKLFLTQGYSINDLSKDTGIPVYKISPAINSCNQTNFNQWINQYRIEEFELLIEQGYQDQLTLDGIAEKCGFSNRATFISAFKKVKGVTPGVYIKNQMTPIS